MDESVTVRPRVARGPTPARQTQPADARARPVPASTRARCDFITAHDLSDQMVRATRCAGTPCAASAAPVASVSMCWARAWSGPLHASVEHGLRLNVTSPATTAMVYPDAQQHRCLSSHARARCAQAATSGHEFEFSLTDEDMQSSARPRPTPSPSPHSPPRPTVGRTAAPCTRIFTWRSLYSRGATRRT